MMDEVKESEDVLWETSSVDSDDSTYLLDLADATEDDVILPKTSYHSPYYVSVPTPKSSSIGKGTRRVGSRNDVTELYEEDGENKVREFPTDVMADRFQKWRKVLKGLGMYLREVASAQEQFARINYQLKNSVKFSFLEDLDEGTNRVVDPLLSSVQKSATSTHVQSQSGTGMRRVPKLSEHNTASASLFGSASDFSPDLMFDTDDSCAASGFMKFGSGSVQDLQVVLKKYHLSMSSQQIKASKEIMQHVVPSLDELRKDLSQKIKEIKELNSDFRTNIQEHVALTGQLLNKYIASVNFLNDNSSNSDFIKLNGNRKLKPKHDPYLLKLQLDLQLKQQLLEENYLQESYINLQRSGMELEQIVYSEIQKVLQKYSTIIDLQARLSIDNLCQELQRGMLSKYACFEWDHFVTHHPKCLIPWKSTEPTPQPRKLSDIRYPKMKSPLAKCIRAGYLLKKSKFLKQYHRGYFLLTSNYLHEFKSSNFFKGNEETSEKDDHAIVSSNATKKCTLTPIMSIPLNEVLLKILENKFIISGNPSKIFDLEEKEHRSSTVKKQSNSSASVSKFWKASLKQVNNSSTSLMKGTLTDDTSKLNTIHLKKPSDVDQKEFKKWEHNLRDLTSFSDTIDRANYIEDKILKAHTKVTTCLQETKPQSSSKVIDRPQKPQFINIAAAMAPNMRSRVNTPAIDDNGNLIFAAERPKTAFQVQGNGTYPTSPLSSSTEVSPKLVLSSSGNSSIDKQIGSGYVITSNGISPVQNSFPNKVISPGIIHSGERNTLILQSSGNTSASDASGESSGGYFAIPINRESKVPTPGTNTGSSSGIVPMIRVHESDDGKRSPMLSDYATETNISRNPNGNPEKVSSLNNISSLYSHPSPRSPPPVFLNHSHSNSTNSLQTFKPQQNNPVRKHKKTVSFTSLNTLLFSKKNNTSGNSQYLSDSKIGERESSNGIDLNKSLYS